MREIIADVLASPVPVVGYVAPSGVISDIPADTPRAA
jgi:membrane-bound ClpP family serine protease